MKRERVRLGLEKLPCTLTDDELREYGERLAAQTTAIEETKTLQKDEKKKMRDELKVLEADRVTLAGVIDARSEDREVAVEIWHNYDALLVETVRTDTGRVAFTRKMTDDELQRPLPGVE